MNYIDLTVDLNEQTPFYEGDPATKIELHAAVKTDGYSDHVVTMATHVGTHVDAPSHMIADGKTLDQYPVDHFLGRGRYVRLADKKFDVSQLEQADIHEGDVVLFDTGMGVSYGQPEYYDNYPAMTEEVAKFLVERKIRMVGVDMCSPDHEPFAVHKILLGADVLIIENLTNLGSLEGKEFKVCALPIKLQVDGAPARVIAEVID